MCPILMALHSQRSWDAPNCPVFIISIYFDPISHDCHHFSSSFSSSLPGFILLRGHFESEYISAECTVVIEEHETIAYGFASNLKQRGRAVNLALAISLPPVASNSAMKVAMKSTLSTT